MRDFLAPFLTADAGSCKCITDGEDLVVSDGKLRGSRTSIRGVVWAEVEKCISHIDEDTGRAIREGLQHDHGRTLRHFRAARTKQSVGSLN